MIKYENSIPSYIYFIFFTSRNLEICIKRMSFFINMDIGKIVRITFFSGNLIFNSNSKLIKIKSPKLFSFTYSKCSTNLCDLQHWRII